MSLQVQIRPAHRKDMESIAHLMRGLGFDHSAEEIDRRMTMVRDNTMDPALIAQVGEHAAGLVALHIAPMLFYPKPIARITTLVVDETFRRRGIGRTLVEAASALAAQAGCDTLELTTGLHREEAHSFYEALGFEGLAHRMVRSLATVR
jgi:ribosomal protein S18 acetylase RimI-like enzyme